MKPWDGICEFVAVAESESFTQASRRLGVSTAQTSRQITALESKLAVKLFYRTTRNVSLTQDGRVYYQHCRAILDALDTAKTAVTESHANPSGKISLTAPVAYGEDSIMPLINDFLIRYPAIDIKVELTNRQVDLVEERYDLAIRLGHLPSSSMFARRLSQRTLYTCAAPSYLAQRGYPTVLSQLSEHNCLLGTLEHWRFNEPSKGQSLHKINGNLRCNSGRSLLDAALKGIGIVQLPDYYVNHYLARGELEVILAPYQTGSEGIWAIYPQNRHLSEKIRLLLDFLQHALTSNIVPT